LRIGNKPFDFDFDDVEGTGKRLRKIRGGIEGSLIRTEDKAVQLLSSRRPPGGQMMLSSRQLPLGPAAMKWGYFSR